MREARTLRPYLCFGTGVAALVLLAVLLAPPPPELHAQTASASSAGRAIELSPERATQDVDDGFYFVNDDFKFTIAHKYGITLMRFAGDEEVFVLNVERGPVGSRVLKYDTGDVALQVTGYGAVTLYTNTAPGGLPAERVGPGEAMAFPFPTMSMLRAQAQKIANRVEQVNHLLLIFDADWARVDDNAARYLTLDAMRITARTLATLSATQAGLTRLQRRVQTVRVMRGDRPGIAIRSQVLYVTIAPVYGLRGRMSSLAMTRALRAMLFR